MAKISLKNNFRLELVFDLGSQLKRCDSSQMSLLEKKVMNISQLSNITHKPIELKLKGSLRHNSC